MNPDRVRDLLSRLRNREIDIEEVLRQVCALPFEDLGFARIDHHRGIRCGFPEVIFCPGKTTEQILRIAEAIIDKGADLLATRASDEVFAAMQARFPAVVCHTAARAVTLKQAGRPAPAGTILILAAGTADIPVAEEARVTADIMDNKVETAYDVGVAGIHRLLSQREAIQRANVLVAVAGMEGALASVVGGLVSRPVIAVPTSVGYGASFGGIAPLLTMLNSCAAGVTVVNIDNGFGAGYVASLINRTGMDDETG